MECQNCFTAWMQKPTNNHPAYLECPNCGAIELTYVPQDYQEGLHSVDYEEYWDEDKQEWALKMQIIGAFGGRKSHSPLKTSQIR